MANPIPEIVAALEAKIEATPETVVMEIPCPDGRQGCLVFHQRPIPNPDYLALVQAHEDVPVPCAHTLHLGGTHEKDCSGWVTESAPEYWPDWRKDADTEAQLRRVATDLELGEMLIAENVDGSCEVVFSRSVHHGPHADTRIDAIAAAVMEAIG